MSKAKYRSAAEGFEGEPLAALAPLEQRADVTMHTGTGSPRELPRWEILWFGITVPVRFIEPPPSV